MVTMPASKRPRKPPEPPTVPPDFLCEWCYRPECLPGKFHYWPPPARKGLPYGPNWKQRLLFLDRLSIEEKTELQNRGIVLKGEDGRAVGGPLAHLHGMDVVLVIGGARSGKCFQKGTQVLRFDGSVANVEDVKVGDLLLGPDSQKRTVVSLARGREKMFKIIPNRGNAFVCNESHTLTLKSSGLRLHFKTENGKKREFFEKAGTVHNMTVQEYLALSKKKQKCFKIYRTEGIEFGTKQRKLSLDPYFLGLWLGDGTATGTQITNPEPEIAAYIEDYAASFGLYVRRGHRRPSKTCPDLIITSGNSVQKNPVLGLLRENGLIQNKHIPQQYLVASRKNRLRLLAGLLDTDGHLSNECYYEISQKSKTLATQIVFLARSLGFTATIKENRKACVKPDGSRKWGTYYRINIFGNVEKIPLRVERKKLKKSLKHRTDHLVTGFEIEELSEDDYYGFELAGADRLFLLADFTVVHNSIGSTARGNDVARRFTKAKILVGAVDFPLLMSTTGEDWRELWTIDDDWDRPDIRVKITQNDRRMRLKNGAMVTFLNLEKPKKLRGRKADFIHIDEASLLPHAKSVDELILRLSSNAVPFKQLILSTNPEQTFGWVYDRFNLRQFEEDYTGEPQPIGRPCQCQYCVFCREKKIGSELIEWVDRKCPKCKAEKPDDCPGGQYYQRVIFFYPDDNPHLPVGYQSDMQGSMSDDAYQILSEGRVKEIRNGVIYTEYSHRTDNGNLLAQNMPIKEHLDIIWTLDFNKNPQCSLICQEWKEGGKLKIVVQDEIVKWRASAHAIARIFVQKIKRLANWKGQVLIYGDPSGFTGGTDDVKHNYDIISEILEKEKIPFTVLTRPTRYSWDKRIFSVKHLLCDDQGYRTVLVNPQAENFLESLRGTEWDAKGEKESEKCDARARDNPDKSHPMIMTHPGCAFGYYIIEAHPVSEELWRSHFVLAPDGTLMEISKDGQFKEFIPEGVQEEQLEIDDYDSIFPPEGPNEPEGMGAYFRSHGGFA
jgi:PBSX family phage terminase large subunit